MSSEQEKDDQKNNDQKNNDQKNLVQPLMDWFIKVKRPLPWRMTKDPYHIWLSEIMLQQTRISAVLEYYRRFTETLGDIEALALVDDDALMKLWQGLGYYSRARNLKKAAKVLVEQYNSAFPQDYDKIRALPGIGDYTAGAIASIAFDIPVPAVDGNVLRVMTRLRADDSNISKEATKKQYRKLLSDIIPKDSPGEFNQALMELGERICLPNGVPLCEECPLQNNCAAHHKKQELNFPVKETAKTRRIESRKVWILIFNDKVALRKRPEKGLLAGLWELPNQLAQETDIPGACGIKLKSPAKEISSGKHIFSHLEWHMTALAARTADSELPEGFIWADKKELEETYALPNAFSFVMPVLNELF